jgi:hypothetical protein
MQNSQFDFDVITGPSVPEDHKPTTPQSPPPAQPASREPAQQRTH